MRKDLPEDREDIAKKEEPRQKSPGTKRKSRLALLKASWQEAFRIDRSQITAFQAIRSTFGVALPLALGVATGQVLTGVVIASGALMLGSVGLKDPYRTRARAMLLACLFVAFSTLVGGLVGSAGWLPVAVIGIWGVVAGMFASISQVAQVVGIQSCIALVVYARFGLDPLHAVFTAGLVGSGTLLQTILSMLPSPWKNTAPERSALAAIYQQLADYAANPFSEQGVLLVSEALVAGYTTLLNSDTRSEKGQMFARLLEEAERLRLTLSILARLCQRLQKEEREPQEERASVLLDRIFRASADELRMIALALKSSSSQVEPAGSEPSKEIKEALVELRGIAQTAHDKDEIQQILPHCTALLGELHMARRLAISWRYARQYRPVRIHFPYPRPPALHLESVWSNIRANLTPRSSSFRHAIRLGVTLALATALYQIFHLPVNRGYWIPMTAALVLRADFTTTFTRGIARLLGTTLGAVLTTLLIVFLAPSHALLVVIITIAAYLMYSTLFANYAIFSVATTMAVVFLLSFAVSQTLSLAESRAIDTVIGGLLALLMYALWPTWEELQVPENIAKRLEALGRSLVSVMQAYADPNVPPVRLLSREHLESRLARSNALGSVQRSLQEPLEHRVDAKLAGDLLGAADNIARHGLALEAYLLNNPQRATLPEIASFSRTVGEALSRLAAAIRQRQRTVTLPDLQAALQALKTASKTQPNEARTQWQFVLGEAKQIVANIRAMQQLLATSSFA